MEFVNREPSLPKSQSEKEQSQRCIFILEGAVLETAKIGNEYQLLNGEDHKNFLGKHKRDPKDYRPDIVHQCLLALLDSPLNKAGRMQVFVHTSKNVLIEVNPRTRIPRTYKRFAGLMVQLLHKLKIRASNGPETLLRVIKNPVTDHIPSNALIFGASFEGQLVKLSEFAATLPTDRPLAFVVGAFAHGEIQIDYAEENIAFSEFPLSAAGACGKLCCTLEDLWDIL